MSEPAIPESWVQRYVDQLLAFAKGLPEGSALRQAALMRADHAMDLVQAYRASQS